jgi:hypothetical protein
LWRYLIFRLFVFVVDRLFQHVPKMRQIVIIAAGVVLPTVNENDDDRILGIIVETGYFLAKPRICARSWQQP